MALRADLECFHPTGNAQAEMGHSQTKQIDKIPVEQRAVWLVKKERKITCGRESA